MQERRWKEGVATRARQNGALGATGASGVKWGRKGCAGLGRIAILHEWLPKTQYTPPI